MLLQSSTACRSFISKLRWNIFRPRPPFPRRHVISPSIPAQLRDPERSSLTFHNAVQRLDDSEFPEGTEEYHMAMTQYRRQYLSQMPTRREQYENTRDHVFVVVPLLHGAFYRRRIFPHARVKDTQKLADAIVPLVTFPRSDLDSTEGENSQSNPGQVIEDTIQAVSADTSPSQTKPVNPQPDQDGNATESANPPNSIPNKPSPPTHQDTQTQREAYFGKNIPYSFGSLKWTIDRQGDALNRRLSLRFREECVSLYDKIMSAADQLNHHPHITIFPPHRRVGRAWTMLVTCTSHRPRGLGMNDVKLARKINEIILQSGYNVTYSGELSPEPGDAVYPLWKKRFGVHAERITRRNREQINRALGGIRGYMFGKATKPVWEVGAPPMGRLPDDVVRRR